MRRLLRAYSNKAESALGERFQQIVDEKLHLATSLVDLDPTLQRIYRSYNPDNSEEHTKNDADDRRFNAEFQKEIAYVKSEKHLRSKEARNLADTITNPPWTGTERVQDTALRMLVDAAPRPKPTRTIITPPVPVRDRIRNAKESSLDYKVGKSKETPDDNFREMYRERLMGPSMFVDTSSPRATMGLIGTMADARINEAIDKRTGKFESPDMDSVRGKPLDKQRLANSTDTNYFINQILNSQDCLPPWIESQQGVEQDTRAFRLDLQQKWFKLVIGRLAKGPDLKSQVMSLLEDEKYLQKSTYDNEFQLSHIAYIRAKIDDINRGIRSYNLQSPSSNLHKWKLVESTEVERLFETVMQNIHGLVDEWFQKQNNVRQIQVKNRGGDSMFGLFDTSLARSTGTAGYVTVERPTQKLDFWKLVKRMFLSEPQQ